MDEGERAEARLGDLWHYSGLVNYQTHRILRAMLVIKKPLYPGKQ